MEENKSLVYFNGSLQRYFLGLIKTVEIPCLVSSTIWQFGGHTIPTHAISDVYYTKEKSPRIWAILSIIFLLLSIWDYDEWDFGIVYCMEFFIPMIVFAIMWIVLSLNKKDRIVVVSKGIKREILDIKEGEEAKKLYTSMLNCFEGGIDIPNNIEQS